MKTVLRPTLDAAFRLGWFWGENNGWASRVQAQGALASEGFALSEHNVFEFMAGAEDGRKGDNRRMMRRKMTPAPTWGINRTRVRQVGAGHAFGAWGSVGDRTFSRMFYDADEGARWLAACLSNAGREFAERAGYVEVD